jgi:hypothetical protein
MGVSYLGSPVEADLDELVASGTLRTLTSVVDEKSNCMRIYCAGTLGDITYSDGFSSSCVRFNYWFDTGRWSVDTLQSTNPQWATYHLGKNYVIWGNQIQSAIAYEDDSVHTDVGNFFAMEVHTGWIRFGDLNSFKRVWRTLIALEVPANNASNLRTVISTDFGAPINSDTFLYTDLGAGGTKLLRIHHLKQKVRSVQVSLVESEGDDPDPSGFRFYGIGFELGMKRGAYKAATISR